MQSEAFRSEKRKRNMENTYHCYNKQKFIVWKWGAAADNILNTITAHRKERNWSLYDLATHTEMKSTTISTRYNDNTIPYIPSIVMSMENSVYLEITKG